MTALVLAAVLAAAVTHAVWNALTHRIDHEPACLTLLGVGRVVCGGTLALLAPLPSAAAWPYLLASVALHVGYQLALIRSFRLGDFGQVYPIARGVAPLAVTLFAVLALHERLDGSTAAGVAVAATGLVGLAIWGARGQARKPTLPPVLMSALTGLAIAAYTVTDGVGVRSADTTAGYIGWLMLLDGTVIPLWSAAVLRGRLLPRVREALWPGLSAGALSVLSYGLVLWAQARAPLAPVAVLRESSVIVGAAIGAWSLRERFGTPRLVAAALVLTGIGLMLAGP
ncbi:EamA family transporter (plasmid) [Streptomyces sp. HUAS TT11]|uniref:EamA family transporter n=1 Tax=Streptomyces sp. HUAS TT11 TaxID=3447508 RepID=UPI003F65763D